MRLPLGVRSRDLCGSGPDSAPVSHVTWPSYPSEFVCFFEKGLVDQLTSQAPPARPLKDAQSACSLVKGLSEYEDVWTSLLWGNPRWNVVLNLEGLPGCMRSPGASLPLHAQAHTHTHTHTHACKHFPLTAGLSTEQKMLALSRALLPLHNSTLSAQSGAPLSVLQSGASTPTRPHPLRMLGPWEP